MQSATSPPDTEINVQEITDLSDDQVASQDEYEISLAEGVDDETLLETTGTKKFTITSYGADYTVDSLVKRMKGKSFKIPDFQRRFVWSQGHASKFIESLLMGLPVPGIFLYREAETNKSLVVDGQQRLRTLEAFYAGTFNEKKFRLTNVREPWTGKTYDELDGADQLKLDDSIVHATIFTQDQPADALESIYFVFERINSGGIRLSPQEIRNCIAAGPFISLVKKLNENTHWRKIFGGPVNKRAKDEELIVRFFAMLDYRDKYARPMAKFLNEYSVLMNNSSSDQLDQHGDIFEKTIGVINEALNGRAFRPVRSLNAAVFDSVMVGVASRIISGNPIDSGKVAEIYQNLLSSNDFRRSWIRATADEESVKSRMEASVSAFSAE